MEVKVNPQQEKRYRENGDWSETTLLERFLEVVNRYPDREFVVDDRGNRYTYRELDEAAGKVAAYLSEQGIKPHDVVSFQIPVWSEFVIIAMGCLKAGAILHPVALCYEAADLVFVLNLTGAKAYFGPVYFHKKDCEARILGIREKIPSLKTIVLLDDLKEKTSGCVTLKEILEQYKPVGTEFLQTVRNEMTGYDVAVILGTSGTTGGSKGVMFTHNNILFSEDGFNRAFGLCKDDIMFMPAPLNHATGFHHGIIAPMLLGAKVVLQQKFRCREAIALMNQEHCTYSMGSTPFIYDILKCMEEEGGQLKDLRFYLCGGAPVPGDMVRKAERFGIRLCEVYGTTESVPHVYVRPGEALRLNGTTSGRAMDGVEVKLVDENRKEVPPGIVGEEASRGPNVFVGYINAKEETDRVLDDEGWFYSGDLCVSDELGNIRVVGRKKDMIVRGGENLNVNLIDSDIEGCPGIRDHTVIGMPDERLGERICAYVVLEEGVKTMDLSVLLDWFLKRNIPKRFWPEHLEITDEIPRTATGKVKSYLLKQDLERRRKNE